MTNISYLSSLLRTLETSFRPFHNFDKMARDLLIFSRYSPFLIVSVHIFKRVKDIKTSTIKIKKMVFD